MASLRKGFALLGDDQNLLTCLLIMVLLISPPVFGLSLETQDVHKRYSPTNHEALQRTSDPLILQANQISDFIKTPIEQLALFRFSSVGFTAIPFQIDEKDNEGQWIFTSGDEANPDDSNGLFDGEDELVFMAVDVGEKSPQGFQPTGARQTIEIQVQDPNGGGGFVYLASFASKAPRSDKDYVHYDPHIKMVTTPFYRMGFHPEFPIGIGHLAILPAAGGDGINSVDRMKVRVDVETVFGIDFTRHEEDFTSVDVAYIDGPVRVLRRTRNRMHLILSIPTPSAIIDNLYYRDFFLFPTEVDIPFNLGLIVNNMRFRTSVDLTAVAKGRTFYHSNSATGTIFDGRMSDDEQNLEKSPVSWMAQMQKQGGTHTGWLNRLLIEKREPKLTPLLYYRDKIDTPDPPEAHSGQFGDTGFIIEDFPRLEAGIYRLVSIMYCVPGYEPGMERKYLDIIDTPLTLSLEHH